MANETTPACGGGFSYNEQVLRNYQNYVLATLLSICGILLSYELFLRIQYELSGALADDALIYLAIGRGILNGLTPYRDLFETKPPGIFLLNAVSLALTGNVGLLKIFQSLTLLLIVGVIQVGAWLRGNGLQRSERMLALLLGTVFGLLLSLYTATMAGEGQVESFGAAFALLALLGLLHYSKRWWGILGIAIAIVMGIGIKEPFLFSFLAGALVLRIRARAIALPLIIALILGIVILAFLGYLTPYLTIYLPHMLSTHAVAHVPLLQRSFPLARLILNITSFSSFLAISVAILLVGTLAAGFHRTDSHASFVWAGRVLGGLWLTLLAIGIGGDFYGHHFVFSVPFLGACFWAFSTAAEERPCPPLRIAMALFVAFLIGAAVFHSRLDYPSARKTWEERHKELMQVAETVDTIMDRCGFSRYLHLKPKGGGPFAYTRHSPEGPVFTQYSRFMGFENSPFTDPFKQVLLKTPLILLTDIDAIRMTVVTKRYVRANFSPQPPDCAGEISSLQKEYSLLFRH